MTTGSPPSITATTELVVPRSMPMILLMSSRPSCAAHVPLEEEDDAIYGVAIILSE
jgi:hypothetical protein